MIHITDSIDPFIALQFQTNLLLKTFKLSLKKKKKVLLPISTQKTEDRRARTFVHQEVQENIEHEMFS
jgi:hypothetical protein